MPYKYPLAINRKQIDEAGAVLLTTGFAVYGTLGAYIEMPFTVTASGKDGGGLANETVFDRMFSFRWKLYTQSGSPSPAQSSNGFRLKTGSVVAGAAPMEFFSSNGAIAEPNRNYSATLEVVSATVVAIVFRFYCTSEGPEYAPFFVNNLNRLLASQNKGEYMKLEPGTQFELGATGISVVTLVSDAPPTTPQTPPYVTVTTATGAGKEYWTAINMKWPGRNAGNTAYHLPLDVFDVTNLGGDVMATKTHKDLALPHQALYDDNFYTFSQSISAFEDNIFRFSFKLGALGALTATAVRVFLLRVDDINNSLRFLIDYEASVVSLPASDTTQTGLGGAIYAPASFTSGATYEVKFRVQGTALTYGARYRAIAVLYGTTASEVYSGISQELYCNYIPRIYPQADIFFADYFKESVLPKGIAAYHAGYRARIEVIKATVADAFTYYGLTGTFDDNVEYVKGEALLPGQESTTDFVPGNDNNRFLWTRAAGFTTGQDYTNTSQYLFGAFTSYMDEEWLPYASEVEADYYITVQWEIGVALTLPNEETVLLVCQYRQNIVARRWESEVGQPTSPPFALEMNLYRSNGITPIPPGTQRICGAEEILAVVEKFDVLRAPGLDAYCIPETYAESNTDGDTVSGAIKQRRGAFAGYLPAATNPEINAYDAQFSFNVVAGSNIDDAGIRVDVSDLFPSSRHWLVALARPINPDEGPFIAVNAEVEMVRSGGNVTTVTADFTAWRAAFDALLTGADTPIDFRIKNAVTQNFAGIVDGGTGNPSGNADTCVVTIDHAITPIKVIEVVYEIEGTVAGHLVRFMYRGQLTLPVAAGTITATITPGLWKIMDYDY